MITIFFWGGGWAFWGGSFYPSNTLDRTLVGCRQWPEDDGCLGKHLHRKRQVLVKGCLEAPYLLTAGVFSICLPHFQGIWEM